MVGVKVLDVDSVLREWVPTWTQVESQSTIWDSLGLFVVLCAIIVAIATAAVVWRKRVSTKYPYMSGKLSRFLNFQFPEI